jgi:hypothetical protein
MYEGTVIAMQPPPPYTVSVDDLIGKLEAVKRKIGGNAKVAIRGRGYTVPLNDQAVVVGSARTIPDNPDRLNPVLLIGK